MGFLTWAKTPPPTEADILATVSPERLSEVYRVSLAKKCKENLEAAFHDDKGRLWSTFRDDSLLPISRIAEQHTHLQYMAAGLSAETWAKALDAINVCFAKSDMIGAGVVLHGLRDLEKRIVNLDAMVNVLAVNYVREDEDPTVINAAIHAEKCDYLKSETEQGRFFFRLPMCLRLLNVATLSTEESQTLWTNYVKEKQNLLRVWSMRTSDPPTEK
jgi:hypothetical protein